MATVSGADKKPAGVAIPGLLPGSHWQQTALDVNDDIDDDGASSVGSFTESTASLTASIYEYRSLHGRTYHDVDKAGGWNPNDAKHAESMDIYHHVHTLLYDGKLHQAPLKKDIKKVLDVGTGTGIWCIDFADENPDTEVIGTDLSPMQPSWVSPNVKFEIDNAEEDWTWPDNTFDFIHVRTLVGSIKDWDRFYAQAYRVLKPGGYLEHHENSVDWKCRKGSITPDSALGQWGRVFWKAGEMAGRSFRILEDNLQQNGMGKAGFKDLTVKEWEVPFIFSAWPEEKDKHVRTIGAFTRGTLDSDVMGWVVYMWKSVLGWSDEQVKAYWAHCHAQLKNPASRPWQAHRVVFGRKPE